jgi:hypothetical protein
MRILFFIESLRCGGKERRLLELIQYLKENTGFEMILVLTENKIQYPHVNELGVPIKVIKRKYLKRDPMLFFRFYKLCNEVKPDIIHTWGSMSLSLRIYLILTAILQTSRFIEKNPDFNI